MTKRVEQTDWATLHDIHAESAALPRLLDTIVSGASERARQEAQAKFWHRISDDSMVPEAAAPALRAYFSFVETGTIPITADFLFGCSTLYDECAPSSDDTAEMLLNKANVRRAIESQKPYFRELAIAHPDPAAQSMAFDLLIQSGERTVDLLLERFQSAQTPDGRSNVLYLLDKVRAEIPHWEDLLLKCVANDAGTARFHAAALLILQHHPQSGQLTNVLREFPSLVFASYSNLLFEACAALPPADRESVLRDVLVATKNSDHATYVSREYLAAVFEVTLTPLNREMESGHEGVIYTWIPTRPYSHRKKLDSAARRDLCAFLAGCDPLWLDSRKLPIQGNLWRQFGLPENRAAMIEAGQRDQRIVQT